MPRLTAEEKAERRFNRMLEKAKESGTQYYQPKVAVKFQEMIRAEAGAADDRLFVCVDKYGQIQTKRVELGMVVCATCGKVGPWKGGSHAPGGGMHCGHFEGSRRNSILFEPRNVAVQCHHCNITLDGNRGNYEIWMRYVYGQDEIDRLKRIRHESVKFDLAELVRMKIEYIDRLAVAVEKMK